MNKSHKYNDKKINQTQKNPYFMVPVTDNFNIGKSVVLGIWIVVIFGVGIMCYDWERLRVRFWIDASVYFLT